MSIVVKGQSTDRACDQHLCQSLTVRVELSGQKVFRTNNLCSFWQSEQQMCICLLTAWDESQAFYTPQRGTPLLLGSMVRGLASPQLIIWHPCITGKRKTYFKTIHVASTYTPKRRKPSLPSGDGYGNGFSDINREQRDICSTPGDAEAQNDLLRIL